MRHQRPSPSILCLPSLRLLGGCLLLALAACETPQAPRFETDFYIPIGGVRTTGLEVLEESAQLIADSTGVDPMAFGFDGGIDRILAGEFLDFPMGSAEFSVVIDTIRFDTPANIAVEFNLAEMSGLPVPPDGGWVVVPPFSFPPSMERELANREEYQWVRVLEGEATVRIENDLPVPIGAEGGFGTLLFQMWNRGDAFPLIDELLSGEIGPGGLREWILDLDGLAFDEKLDIRLLGGSSGSGADSVWVEPSQGVSVFIEFASFRPDSLIAPVDEQSVVSRGRLGLAPDLRIVEGEIRSGSIPVEVVNELPLQVESALSFPELTVDGEVVSRTATLPAAEPGLPTRADIFIDLTGADVSMEGGVPRDSVEYRLDARTPGSLGGEVSLGRVLGLQARINETPVSMEWARGTSDGRSFDVPPTEQEFGPPSGIDEVEFLQASLVVDITSTVGLPTNAHFSFEASGADGATGLLPIDVDIPKGSLDEPSQVRVVFDEANSNVLDVINVKPRRISVGGTVLAGDPGEIGTVRREEWIEGSYSLVAPLRVIVSRLDQSIDAFSFTVLERDQDRIRDDILSAEFIGEIENHLPLEVVGSIRFADREADLDGSADVVLDPVRVGAAQTDPVSGRAVESTVGAFTAVLEPDEIDFFARAEVWARFDLVLEGDGVTPVAIAATDFVELRGHLRLRMDVHP